MHHLHSKKYNDRKKNDYGDSDAPATVAFSSEGRADVGRGRGLGGDCAVGCAGARTSSLLMLPTVLVVVSSEPRPRLMLRGTVGVGPPVTVSESPVSSSRAAPSAIWLPLVAVVVPLGSDWTRRAGMLGRWGGARLRMDAPADCPLGWAVLDGAVLGLGGAGLGTAGLEGAAGPGWAGGSTSGIVDAVVADRPRPSIDGFCGSGGLAPRGALAVVGLEAGAGVGVGAGPGPEDGPDRLEGLEGGAGLAAGLVPSDGLGGAASGTPERVPAPLMLVTRATRASGRGAGTG